MVGESEGMLSRSDRHIYLLPNCYYINKCISTFINDKVILYKFNNKKEILKDHNTQGQVLLSLAIYLATGMIIFGSISGEGGGIITLLAFWAIGQVSFIIMSDLYII